MRTLPTALSDSGLVAGTSTAYDLSGPGPYPVTATIVWLWDPVNGMRDLNLLVAGSGWTITEVSGANAAGQLLGKGIHGGQDRVFLLQL